MHRITICLTVCGGMALSTPAIAGDPASYKAIAAGNLPAAARQLEAERQVYPGRPELMLNLAAVYAQTGRSADARSLYQGVLARRSVAMDMPSGAVMSSHDVAERGLARLPQAIATR